MENKRCKVSVCIPAYNNAGAVERLLSSIEKQSYRDYEVIITDDSDTDGIKELVKGKKYVQYYKNAEKLGAAANWNEAIARSSGEYVKIMHHDDWFSGEDSLGKYVGMLESNPEAAFAFSGSRQVGDGADYTRHIAEEDAGLIKEDYRNLFLGNTIGAPSSVIVRRSTLEKAGGIFYDDKLTWLVDMEYYMHILKENNCFVYTKEPLVTIGMGKGQLTGQCQDDPELKAFEYGYIYEKYRLGKKGENGEGGEGKAYRDKLISVLTDAGKSSSEAAVYGIEEKEYRMEEKRRLVSKIKWKISHMCNGRVFLGVLLLAFIVSMIPVLYLSGVNHATGDDFGYGRFTHEAWKHTHSLVEVAKAAGRTIKQYYYGWQGTWFSVFLFTLQPEVFSPKAYIIVPALMLALWLGSTGLLTYYLLVRKAGFDRMHWGILYLLFAMAGIQFVPSTKSSIFWYNGNAHYTIPFAVALLGIYLYFRFMDAKAGQGIGFYAGLNICMVLLGGGNYQAALLAPLVMVLAAALQWKEKGKRKRLLLFILPLVLELTGLVISMIAPGNKVRGGEDFGFSVSAAAGTVFTCFGRGAVQAFQYLKEHPLLLLFFILAAAVLWKMPQREGEERKYPYPLLFAVLSYCVYCAGFAPEIYAGVEVSGGVYNMNYYLFLFMVFGDLIYLEGALKYYVKKDRIRMLLPVVVLTSAACLLVFRSDIKHTTTYKCMEYIRSGQAADFKKQVEYQLSVLLDDSIRDAVLPMTNDDQGPLMNMPVTDNPEAWTNGVVRDFYEKDSVVGVDGAAFQY